MAELKKKTSNKLYGWLSLLILLLCACTEVPELGNATMSGNTLIDRDGQRYNTVLIGNQRWMAQNLNYQTDNDPCYAGKLSYCETYGRLYNWNAAMKACPNGWHLPSDAEWDTLVNFAGGPSTAGIELKSTSGWNGNGNGTDIHEFSALPGGYWSGSFNDVGSYGNWWSATADGASGAWSRSLYYDGNSVGRSSNSKADLFSVRCVMDVQREAQ